jgi:hypothetical protein
MFWMIALTALSTIATVTVGAVSMAEGKKQTDRMVKDQDEHSLASAFISYGTALNGAPTAISI